MVPPLKPQLKPPLASPVKAHAKKQGGQVALFIALIFQVLFVFFAMLVNVGLLVHHKINLQNSVDLAAYYGAMKQAETMNAIAHVNYQIRQSWKLLNFRYRHLGDWGASAAPRYVGALSTDTTPPSAGDVASDVKTPVFCINYSPFAQMTPGEQYCKDANTGTGILTYPPVPNFGSVSSLLAMVDSGLTTFLATTTSIFQNMQNKLGANCQAMRAYNVFALSRFIWAYKQDISMRKRLIVSLAKNMSQQSPLDLDGNAISDGVKQTLKKNLTYQNNDGLQKVQFYNSMSDANCAPQPGAMAPPQWLQEIFVFPLLYDWVAKCNTGATLYSAGLLNNAITPKDANVLATLSDPTWGAYLTQALALLDEANTVGGEAALYNSSLGYEKNPWCVSYVGVSATSKPQIPFSPFGSITLSATAYAKPFGGTIGPWYSNSWPYSTSAAQSISTGSPTDKVQIPRWNLQTGAAPSFSSPTYGDHLPMIDHSRYIGDAAGTASNTTMYYYGRTFVDYFNSATPKPISLDWWSHLSDGTDVLESQGTSGDPLAYSKTDPNYSSMRDFELASVVPDNFDIAYYSIEPDFYRNYYQRLKGGQAPPSYLDSAVMNGRPVRGDLGMNALDSTFKTYSVKEQVTKSWNNNLLQKYGDKLPYFIGRGASTAAFAEVLTSFKLWVSDTLPSVPSYFGKCSVPVSEGAAANFATTGDCISGGRVGYSVKLVDGSFLLNSSNLSLGGSGTSGPILNKPPASLSDSSWQAIGP